MSNRGGAHKRPHADAFAAHRAVHIPTEQEKIAFAQQQVNSLRMSASALIFSQLAAVVIGNLEPGENLDAAEMRRLSGLSKRASLYHAESWGMIQVQDDPVPTAEEKPAEETSEGGIVIAER